jgi:hypothetical protein
VRDDSGHTEEQQKRTAALSRVRDSYDSTDLE